MNAPFIFILDIDGTLIGDISPQVMLYEMVQEMKTTSKKTAMTFDVKDLTYKLENGILRPYFKEFVELMVSQFTDVELFIYTASQKKWALFLIKHIEKTFNVKFNRPIFTRDDCVLENNTYVKSIENIKPRILSSLKRSYPKLTMDKLNNRMIMIDNSQVFRKNELWKVIICPTYDFKYPENILSKIKPEVFCANHVSICSAVIKYMNQIPFTSKFLKFERHFYKTYLQDLFKLKKVNNDTFWIQLGDIIVKKNIMSFDERSINAINIKLNKRRSIT